MAHLDDPQTQKANMAYIRGAMKEPLLEKGHEHDLARRWREKGDEKALHELIRSYTRLVVSAAAKYKNYGLPMGDLIQEGNIGLMQAANRFETDRDVRFSTYANWWIRAAMQDFILRNWSIVRTGTTSAQKSLFFNLRRLRTKIERENEHEGLGEKGRAKIAKELKVNVKDVEDMENRMSGGDNSLNVVVSEDGAEEWQSFLKDDRPNPEDIVMGLRDSKTRSKWLEQALGTLSPREQKIIHDRHLQYESVTLEDLGNELGVSKERIRQLESRALEKLKDSLSSKISSVDDLFGDGLGHY